MSPFVFGEGPPVKAACRAEVPVGIQNYSELFDVLGRILHFPDYFGRNWDALDECIRDFSWLPPGDVILAHKDIPLSGDRRSLATYLEVLHDAVENWNVKGSNLIFASPERWDATGARALLVKRNLVVIFPGETKNDIENIMHGEQPFSPGQQE
jgi:hypothetical protein